ncbi:hypothetical protein PGTUg99_006200 [Puccinia graminis f. sp. tritici]|uniref:Uncharacterized protein n=1 Tax=Puccinia graminis f. sp. tritici TaxID=56615 RepID=A0A5B0RVQ7_PUCGR|nr:hypothetical protein PGTUg99_006200 [Puccinia graminis f. sp. tritici]
MLCKACYGSVAANRFSRSKAQLINFISLYLCLCLKARSRHIDPVQPTSLGGNGPKQTLAHYPSRTGGTPRAEGTVVRDALRQPGITRPDESRG